MTDHPSQPTGQPRRSKPSKPTLRDLAKASGVSFSLASIVMRGAPGAAQETRQRVLRMAAEIGYQPDLNARFLRRGRSRLIGVSFRLTSSFLADVVRAIYDAAGPAGYDVLLGGWADEETQRKAVTTLLGYRSSALILLGPRLPTGELEALAEQLPVVALMSQPEIPAIDWIATDEHAGMRMVVDHLAGLGHRRIVHVDGGEIGVASARRRDGFLDAMAALGLADSARVVAGGETLESGAASADALLAEWDAPTAITTYNDDAALGLSARLEEAGVIVPDDVSVVGYDGGRYTRLLPHRLTTVRQDPRQQGDLAVQRVVARLEHDATPGAHVVLQPSLVVGLSTAAPRDPASADAPGTLRAATASLLGA